MKTTIKKLGISVAAASMLFSTSANAGELGGFVGATEFTQILNNGELAVQTAKIAKQVAMQIKQFEKWKEQMLAYKMMINNIGTFPKQIKARFIGELKAMKKALEFGDAMSYTAANYDRRFRETFKGYDKWLELANGGNLDFTKTYQEFTNSTRDTVRAALKVLNIQEQDLQSDAKFMHAIHSKIQTAKGEKELVLLANEISIHQTEQLKKLQKTIMTQANLEAEWIAHQNDQEAARQAQIAAMHFEPIPEDGDEMPEF
jgi:P-type conjugative transfer protein TrbJ